MLESYVFKESNSRKLKTKHCNMEKLSNKMLEFGVTGFQVDDTDKSEAQFLVKAVGKTMKEYRDDFSTAGRQFSLKERVKILRLAYENQFNDMFSRLGMSKGRVLTFPEDLERFHSGDISLKRVHFVEALVLYCKEADTDWIPPEEFEESVQSIKVLQVFPEEENISVVETPKSVRTDRRSICKVPQSRSLVKEEVKEEPIDASDHSNGFAPGKKKKHPSALNEETSSAKIRKKSADDVSIASKKVKRELEG